MYNVLIFYRNITTTNQLSIDGFIEKSES